MRPPYRHPVRRTGLPHHRRMRRRHRRGRDKEEKGPVGGLGVRSGRAPGGVAESARRAYSTRAARIVPAALVVSSVSIQRSQRLVPSLARRGSCDAVWGEPSGAVPVGSMVRPVGCQDPSEPRTMTRRVPEGAMQPVAWTKRGATRATVGREPLPVHLIIDNLFFVVAANLPSLVTRPRDSR